MTTTKEALHYLYDDIDSAIDQLMVACRAEGVDTAQRWIDSELIQNRHVISLPKNALLAALSISSGAPLPESYGDALPIKEP